MISGATHTPPSQGKEHMELTILTSSPTPIFQQIHNQIVDAVARGHLKPGDALLSVRALAQALAINPATVLKAYNLLKEEGIIEIHPRGKTVVAAGGAVASPPHQAWQDHLHQVLALGLAEGLSPQQIRSAVEDHLTTFTNTHTSA